MSFVVVNGVRINVTGREESKTQRDDPTHSGGRDRTAHSGGAAALVADTPTGATPGATEGAMGGLRMIKLGPPSPTVTTGMTKIAYETGSQTTAVHAVARVIVATRMLSSSARIPAR
jgi:hypothetical protein